MSGVLIVKPEAHGAPPVAAGSGAENLLTADPNEVWIAPSATPVAIQIDMGRMVEVDSFFLGSTNAAADATWTIATNTVVDEGAVDRHAGKMRATDSLGPRHHSFVRLAAPVVSRYFTITVDQGGAVPLFAGNLVLGRAFEKHRERGAGRTLIDTGSRSDLPSGGFGTDDGVVKASFAFSFVDLTDVEVYNLWAIKKDRGLRRPVVVVEDDALTLGQNEAIHYGVFDRFQPTNRVDPEATQWAGAVIEWA
ncbi:MAG TPA: hypothetical protein VF463_08405 [Sphingobium sp.]